MVCGRGSAEENEEGREVEEKKEEEEEGEEGDKEDGGRKRGDDGGLGGHSKSAGEAFCRVFYGKL